MISCTVDESPKKRVTEILNHELPLIKALVKLKLPLDSVTIIKKQNTEKEDCFMTFSPLISLLQVLLILNDRAEETTELSKSSL